MRNDYAVKEFLMLKLKRIFALVSILLASAHFSFAQSEQGGTYVRKGSIGEKKEEKPITNEPFATLPIEQWLNQRFIFMPRTRQFQRFGYDGFAVVTVDKKGKAKYERPLVTGLPYDKYVGRIAKVTAVNKVKPEYSVLERLQIEFALEDTGEKLIHESSGFSKTVRGIAPVAVLDAARQQYLGKTLWIVDPLVYTYDDATGETNFVKVRRYSPVKATDIVVGTENNAPVRLILQTEDGKQGYTDVALSGTNAESLVLSYHKFDDKFLTEDPRAKYPWGEEIWSLIEQGKVQVGMTAQQMRMSLGDPQKINTTDTGSEFTEQWVYGSSRYGSLRFYYFKNGRLTAIQN
jgi:hypothetical protein